MEPMIAARPIQTLADYATVEASSRSKFEFVRGQIVAMTGGTLEHGRLGANIIALLKGATSSTGCTVFSSDVRVGLATSDFRAYPDASVVCGPVETHDNPRHTIVNPVCVVEVLSESTAAYDQGAKLDAYKCIPSLQAVVFVSQEGPAITVHTRGEAGWDVAEYLRGKRFELPGLPGEIAVDDVYA